MLYSERVNFTGRHELRSRLCREFLCHCRDEVAEWLRRCHDPSQWVHEPLLGPSYFRFRGSDIIRNTSTRADNIPTKVLAYVKSRQVPWVYSQLETLPREILNMIAQYLKKHEAQSLRSTSLTIYRRVQGSTGALKQYAAIAFQPFTGWKPSVDRGTKLCVEYIEKDRLREYIFKDKHQHKVIAEYYNVYGQKHGHQFFSLPHLFLEDYYQDDYRHGWRMTREGLAIYGLDIPIQIQTFRFGELGPIELRSVLRDGVWFILLWHYSANKNEYIEMIFDTRNLQLQSWKAELYYHSVVGILEKPDIIRIPKTSVRISGAYLRSIYSDYLWKTHQYIDYQTRWVKDYTKRLQQHFVEL